MNATSEGGRRKVLTARRLTLLASVAGLGAAVLFAGPGPNGTFERVCPRAQRSRTGAGCSAPDRVQDRRALRRWCSG